MADLNDQFSQLLRQQDFPPGCLYVVGTPIGNLADITYRAAFILANVDGIACEDTRHTAILLNHLGLQKPLLALHDHNEREASETLISHLEAGQRWAYVSDAGTPGISDPGGRLVDSCAQHNLRIIPIPGPSAIATLISASGKGMNQSDGQFQFLGFLPTKGKELQRALLSIDTSHLATLIYEAPQRIEATLKHLHETMTDHSRELIIGRELTKKFETITRIPIASVPTWLTSENEFRGEFVILIEGASAVNELNSEKSAASIQLAKVLSKFLGSKQIAEVLSEVGTISKKDAYQLALDIKKPAE